ncbi:hypothetical protein GUJ93_ZPchr0004g38367 [Zizania palustris]|uniref:Uncharacterized protein n=1 Tax=Zizania palustris TaxID=103762 RepID=A0A8J5VAL9_ZIZPA|nr:hypothetical protein GUJ93_ZPchr0004g38367 [Zizania palustris]
MAKTRRSLILCRMPTLSAAAPSASSSRSRMELLLWQQYEEAEPPFRLLGFWKESNLLRNGETQHWAVQTLVNENCYTSLNPSFSNHLWSKNQEASLEKEITSHGQVLIQTPRQGQVQINKRRAAAASTKIFLPTGVLHQANGNPICSLP